MKRRIVFVVGFVLCMLSASGVWSQDNTQLKSRVIAFYNAEARAYAAKDVDGLMSLLADDFQIIFSGVGRDFIRDAVKKIFDGNGEIRREHILVEVNQSGGLIKVVTDEKIEGKSGDQDWKSIAQSTKIDLLVQQNGALKFFRSAEIDKSRLSNVSGRTYKDALAGFSFTAPENWLVFPSKHPLMKGTVYVLASDGGSTASISYLNIPGLDAQKAIEGDEAATSKMSKEGTYKLFNSGPINVGGSDGFETESEFVLSPTPDRHRRRVYINGPGALYVLCFDAIPTKQWEQVKDGFQSLLDSMQFEAR